MGLLSKQARDTKARAGVQVVATGMHQTLPGGGIAQPGALLHRKRIHVHPQTHRGTVIRPQFGHNARAANSLTDPPTQLAKLTRHQSCGLVFLTAELRVGMQMPAQALDLQGLYEQALTASRQGDFVEALPLWDRFLEKAPEDAAALSNRGNVRLALGDVSGAIEDQTASIVLAPEESDPHLNRGTAEEALQDWSAAADDYLWILERDPKDASALYNLANVRGSQGDWPEARELYGQAALARPGFAMARSSEDLAAWQAGDLDWAEAELRKLIRRYPLFADARAALSGLLWREGSSGEAESHWAAAAGLDQRYRQADWLQQVRRWPPQPTADLMAFLALEAS